MHLKNIVASGFKSFADKINVSFDTGITGIVGPNGSGKSNVIDAVRWVMGEQNAKNLRGEKATDIIFAGSERRKALGLAEVSLVFDNSDDNAFCPPEYRHEPEITLTRRIYADGQREYLINRKNCRLKDIVNFFAATGLGGRSYSMIQQGQVDRILNAKPEDVREILEEAAGTTNYKKRKREAEKKLEQTQTNLSRIEDILLEVDQQLENLSHQVEKAREYQELTERLRTEELTLFAHNYEHYRQKKTAFEEDVGAAKEKEAESLGTISSLEARHAELQGQLDDADPDLQNLQESISVLREKIARSESTLKSATERIESGQKRLSDLSEELSEDDANLKVLENQVEAAGKELSEAERGANELREAIETFEQEVETADESAQVYQSRMEEFEDEIRNLERLIESNKYRRETAEAELGKATEQIGQERERLSTLEEELVTVKAEVEEAERKASTKKEGLDREIREKHEREASIASRYEEMKEATEKRDALKEQYHETKARYTSLQELDTGATDVAGALKTLREEEPDVSRMVDGLFTDYVSFRETAEELPPKAKAAFERWAERLLVRSLDDFNGVVRLANQHEAGLIPVSLLTHCEAVDQEAASRWADKVGAEPLTDYLSLDDGAPEGVKTLVSRLYLLPALGLDEASVSDMPRGLIVFTSQGVTLAAQDDFVVGSRESSGLLSRKIELEELAQNLKTIESDLAKAQASIDELEAKIGEDRQVVAEIDGRLQEQNQDVLQVMSDLQSVQQTADRKEEQITEAKGELERLQQAEAKYKEELESLAESRQSLDEELATNRSELENVKEESSSLIERKEELKTQHEAKKLELAKSESRAQTLKDSYLNTKAQLELLQNKLSRRYEERSRIEQDIETAKGEEAQARQDIESFVQERDRLQQDYSEKKEANAGVIEELRVIENQLKEHRDQLAKAQKTVNDKNLQLERVNIAIEGIKDQAMEKHKVDIETFDDFEYDENFNAESKGKTVQRIRSKIDSMGGINMMALQEYEERKERREFIVRQRDEVISSIDLLTEAINEIEETSLRKFRETFETVNEEFGKLFPILFPTGEGKLELTDEENPLEGGVEIMCRLPGKNKKPMSLFSGGEKALTAISLIFALLRTKPTPYCFLDEVDAPLDEANVGRYNRVLEALSSQFQFIVITHNRRTMEVLDTLYGITMQEPGVSKVVGVDMQKDLPSHLRKAFKEDKKPAEKTERALEGASSR